MHKLIAAAFLTGVLVLPHTAFAQSEQGVVKYMVPQPGGGLLTADEARKRGQNITCIAPSEVIAQGTLLTPITHAYVSNCGINGSSFPTNIVHQGQGAYRQPANSGPTAAQMVSGYGGGYERSYQTGYQRPYEYARGYGWQHPYYVQNQFRGQRGYGYQPRMNYQPSLQGAYGYGNVSGTCYDDHRGGCAPGPLSSFSPSIPNAYGLQQARNTYNGANDTCYDNHNGGCASGPLPGFSGTAQNNTYGRRR